MMLIDTTVGWNPCWVSPAATATPTTIRTGDAVTGPAAVELEIVPIPSRPGCFAAYLPDGRGLIRASRQPLLDGARALAAEGAPSETVITVRHRGSTIVAMRSTVGEAGKWRIEESDRGGLKKRRWSPFESARISAHGVPEIARGHVDVGDRPPAAAALLDEAPDQAAQDYLETFAPDRLPTTPTALAAPWGERRKVGCG